MAQEIELKLKLIDAVPVDDLMSQIKSLLPDLDLKCKRLINRYFDTEDRLLNRHKIAMRIRTVGDRFIQTLKTQGTSVNGLHQRGEWEWSIPHNRLDISLLAQCDAWPENIELARLRPVFETNFERYSAELYFGASRIELALDVGEVVAGERRLPICEIELELKSGETADLLGLGQKLKSSLVLEASDISKAEQGYRLAFGSDEA